MLTSNTVVEAVQTGSTKPIQRLTIPAIHLELVHIFTQPKTIAALILLASRTADGMPVIPIREVSQIVRTHTARRTRSRSRKVHMEIALSNVLVRFPDPILSPSTNSKCHKGVRNRLHVAS